MFDKYDKIAKLDILLNIPKFKMIINNYKEIFDKFFTRFTLVIAPLDRSR